MMPCFVRIQDEPQVLRQAKVILCTGCRSPPRQTDIRMYRFQFRSRCRAVAIPSHRPTSSHLQQVVGSLHATSMFISASEVRCTVCSKPIRDRPLHRHVTSCRVVNYHHYHRRAVARAVAEQVTTQARMSIPSRMATILTQLLPLSATPE